VPCSGKQYGVAGAPLADRPCLLLLVQPMLMLLCIVSAGARLNHEHSIWSAMWLPPDLLLREAMFVAAAAVCIVGAATWCHYGRGPREVRCGIQCRKTIAKGFVRCCCCCCCCCRRLVSPWVCSMWSASTPAGAHGSLRSTHAWGEGPCGECDGLVLVLSDLTNAQYKQQSLVLTLWVKEQCCTARMGGGVVW
jgi:hypothetical protein